MLHNILRWSCFLLLSICWGLGVPHRLSAEAPKGIIPTALDKHIAEPDPNYSWSVAKTVDDPRGKTVIISLKSQSWLTAKEVDRPVWEHWLVVSVPKTVKTNKAFLMIGGGGNDRPMPTSADTMTALIAQSVGGVVAELKMVPNQPLIFHGDGQPRKEDDLIGYAWAEFLKSADAEWLPRLPMTKSAVRAMDCLQEYMASEAGGKVAIDQFVVAGGSKRGWTTWMTGVADARVAAIIPIVIDVANCEPSLRHHAEVYGFWAEAIGNYYQHKILQQFDHPRMQDLYRIVDPYYYADRLTMPKFIVNASGDQFFCPDSSQYYFDALPGEKLLRYVPNADHGLKGSDALESIISFYQMIVADKPRPQYNWTFAPDGSIQVKCESKPKEVVLWQAHNPKARDFRLQTIGPAFTSTTLTPNSDGVFVGRVDQPSEGWRAFYIELTFNSGVPQPIKVSTAVRIVPDTLPFAGVDLKTVKYEPEVKGK